MSASVMMGDTSGTPDVTLQLLEWALMFLGIGMGVIVLVTKRVPGIFVLVIFVAYLIVSGPLRENLFQVLFGLGIMPLILVITSVKFSRSYKLAAGIV